MSQPQVMYRGFIGFQWLSMWLPDSLVQQFFRPMDLSQNGQYVQVQRRRLDDQGWEVVREEMSRYWQPTQAQAMAAVAPKLRQIGERMIRQADELEQAAREEISTPAVASESL